jgi:hypothetical protein
MRPAAAGARASSVSSTQAPALDSALMGRGSSQRASGSGGSGRRRSERASIVLSLLALGLGSAGCRVSPPEPADWLAVGFRTPQQTFRTFQTAVRADEPELQRRCFSAGFVAENHLSRRTWLEFWDRLRAEEPFLSKGLADAEIEGTIERDGDRARLVARSHGREIEVRFVLDDFGEVWAGAEAVVDEPIRFQKNVGIQEPGEGQRWIYGQLPLPRSRAVAISDVTELRLGREWKIDGIGLLDEASKSAAPARPERR